MLSKGAKWARLKTLLYTIYYLLFPRFVKGLALVRNDGSDFRAVIPESPTRLYPDDVLVWVHYLNLFGICFLLKSRRVSTSDYERFITNTTRNPSSSREP